MGERFASESIRVSEEAVRQVKKKYAIELARMGFHVFPLIQGGKLPGIKNFPALATRDEGMISDWWDQRPTANIGISTTRFGDDEALVVVDIDNKNGKNGSDEVMKLEFMGFPFPRTFTQHTPTGGIHMVYRAPKPVKQGVDVLAKGLDIRSKGGYIVALGSEIDGKYYTASKDEVAVAPLWLIESCGPAYEKAIEEPENLEKIHQSSAIDRAVDYLLNHAPLGHKGEGGDATAYKVAARVKDFGVDAETCLNLMLDYWNDRTIPGWKPERLKEKVLHAYRYGNRPVGAAAPEVVFAGHEGTSEEDGQIPPSRLVELNQKYALILLEGSHFILKETKDQKGRDKREYLNETSFKRWLSNRRVQLEDGGRSVTEAEQWLSWAGRRQYAGVCFSPEQEPANGYYNLWRGFTCEPLSLIEANSDQRRGLEMFLEHARENICSGNEEHFRWLIGWFAHLIQKPQEKPLTALVFKGRKGTGKNALVERVGKLLGEHFTLASSARYLTSNFNGHFDSCLFFVLDEATWGGDKNAEGTLKSLITGTEILIERKGKETYKVDNYMRIAIIGNEEWLVPATHDERRFAVFEVGEGKMQNREYFKTMRILLDEKGGNRVLLDYLRNFDLTGIDVNDAPKTEGLLNQKERNLRPIEHWWRDSLSSGRIIGSDLSAEWPSGALVEKDRIRDAATRYIKDRLLQKSWLPNEVMLTKELKTICPSLLPDRKREEGRTLHVYKFPNLENARADWERHIGHRVEW